ncbi:DUF418 domain-containing protein [Nonomuraea pusilla]|uniref:DUF418 domain-containing protein n=1 Tax=Nonomuraea pusilla TaxID=46177 RepID=UPI00331DCC74
MPTEHPRHSAGSSRPAAPRPRGHAPSPEPFVPGGRAATPSSRPRIAALDVLRGFALCGILLANVQPIANAGAIVVRAVPGPAGEGVRDAHGWLHLFVDQRFFPVFSVLFGVGFSLLLRSAAERVPRPRLVLLRRLLVLLGMGLAHLLLLWQGDILTVYAAVGLAVLLPSTWLPRGVVAVLAAVFIVGSVAFLGGTYSLVPGLFLLGSALTRYGVTDRMGASAKAPALMAVAFAIAAVPAVAWQAWLEDSGAEGPFSVAAFPLAGLLLAGAYVCGLLALTATRVGRALDVVFAPLGRMALTNYLTATVLVLALRGLPPGAPHTWPLSTVLLIAGSVLAVQWAWSVLWLRRFRYGPLEWLWRWATWGRRPPSRRAAITG